MNMNDFKAEYTKSQVTLKGIDFTLRKIPAVSAAFLFSNLVQKLSHDLENIEITGNNATDMKNIVLGLLSSLDAAYLQGTLMPKLFKYITYTKADSQLKKLNLEQDIAMIESYLEFDDILELIVRGVCVNFLPAISARISKFQAQIA